MTADAMLTPREAAFVLDEQLKSITKMLDAHAEKNQVVKSGGINVRQLSKPELLFFLALRDVGETLTPKGRSALFTELQTNAANHLVSLGPLNLDLRKYERDLEQRLARYQVLKDSVEPVKGAEDPLIAGTGIEVYRISTLLDAGASVDEVLKDYPGLSRSQVESARAYAAAKPKHGRPYPKTSFKSALRRLRFDFPDEPEKA